MSVLSLNLHFILSASTDLLNPFLFFFLKLLKAFVNWAFVLKISFLVNLVQQVQE